MHPHRQCKSAVRQAHAHDDALLLISMHLRGNTSWPHMPPPLSVTVRPAGRLVSPLNTFSSMISYSRHVLTDLAVTFFGHWCSSPVLRSVFIGCLGSWDYFTCINIPTGSRQIRASSALVFTQLSKLFSLQSVSPSNFVILVPLQTYPDRSVFPLHAIRSQFRFAFTYPTSPRMLNLSTGTPVLSTPIVFPALLQVNDSSINILRGAR